MRHLVLALAIVLLACGGSPSGPPGTASGPGAASGTEGTTPSADGVPIHYVSTGTGDAAVVLVHCWGCNLHYWDGAVRALAPRYHVVALDLAGHGQSGKNRKDWTITAFGEDVRAVVGALGLKRVILVGHSMGGPVILEAANLMPDRVVGLVPVDTLHDVDRDMPDEKKQQMFARMRQDFPGTTTELVHHLFPKDADPKIVDRVVFDGTHADPTVGIPALESLFAYRAGPALERIKVPIVAINADLVPTNLDVERRHAPQFEAVIMKGVGHWLMLERPDEFNTDLLSVLDRMHLQ